MPEQSVFSVSQINEYIKMTLESSQVLKNVFLRGEISNFKSNYSSGHLYFSLKDESSSETACFKLRQKKNHLIIPAFSLC